MSVSGGSPLRPALGVIVGLIIGLFIGLATGWWLWPVEYVGDAYTYELNDAEKIQYVAAVVDSYNLTGQVGAARQRFNAWQTEEKVDALAKLFAEYRTQGKMQEAERLLDLATGLQRMEGWDSNVVTQVASQVGARYAEQGAQDKSQAVALFASALGATGVAQPPAVVSTPPISGPQTRPPLLGSFSALLQICGAVLLILVLVLAVVILLRRSRARRTVAEKAPAAVEWTGAGPPPLLQRTSRYALGMDNFDESFAIETDDDKWLGEFGMGIAEKGVLDRGEPRRVAAFEVWLFDKDGTTTVTKVLMSDFAHSNEALRRELLPEVDKEKREPFLAMPGATFTLEGRSLILEARIIEMEYGDGQPALGYFEKLEVELAVHMKSGIDDTENQAPTPWEPGV